MTKLEFGAFLESVIELKNVGHPEAGWKVLENTLARINGTAPNNSDKPKTPKTPAQ